jgi:ATP-dependent DNA helicase RecG
MSLEGQQQDKKSLRAVAGKTADWHELVKDCVAFANATGGRIFIGIEDADYLPPVPWETQTSLQISYQHADHRQADRGRPSRRQR